EVDLSSETRDRLLKSETERIRDERMEAATAAARAKSGAASSTGAKDAGSKGNGAKGNGAKSAADRDVTGESTRWLLWARNSAIETSELPPEELAQRRLPRALARFSLESGAAFLVERPVGDGNVMFVSSGLLSEWNTLPQTNTMFLFDRLLRGMIEATLPPRNFDPQERLALPLTDVDPQQSLLLQRPGRAGADETIDFGNVGRDQRGVTLTNMLQRGFYRIARAGADEAVGAAGGPGAADGTGAGSAGAGAGRSSAGGSSAGGASPGGSAVVLATNGPADESDLAPLPPERREQLEEDNRIRWIEPGESISLAGAQLRGQDSWWYLVFAVLVVLLVELVILGHASLSQGGATASKSAGG
ncbi:MAG TPA: hypothetical protein PLV92_20435, partial [Pirellulaceae bacterium]|nr:hypothetical protein [Pirellulaceae bacterium]